MRLTILLLFIASFAHAQFNYGCNGERYVGEVIENIEKTTVVYGSNIDVFGDSIDLSMDIFAPVDDEADARPVIVFAHGGSFIGGSRQDMQSNCESFAAKGYVAATVDYRLLSIFQGIPDSVSALDITVKASHDMRAAVRWFKASAIEGGNPYNIDPDMMFVGGYSAGAVTALIVGTFDEEDVSLEFIQELLDNNGGFDGSTGNPDYIAYGDEVRGIVNYSGAIYDTAWIDVNDPPILSYHGTADETVPYGLDEVVVLGNPIVPLHGSGSIHDHLENNIQVPNYLYTVEGGGHTDIYFLPSFEEDRAEAIAESDTLLALIICGTLVDVENTEFSELKAYPNPVSSQLYFEGISNSALVKVYNHTGQLVMQQAYGNGLNVMALSRGMYVYVVEDEDEKYLGKFAKQ